MDVRTQLVFIDTEFTGFEDPRLISIGIAASSADEFYAEVECPIESCSEFVREVVQPLLAYGPKLSVEDLSCRLLDWLNLIKKEAGPVIVCCDSDYDRDLFCNIFKNNPPKFLVFRRLGYRHINGLSRSEFFVKNSLPEHHALNDALALRYSFRGWSREVR